MAMSLQVPMVVIPLLLTVLLELEEVTRDTRQVLAFYSLMLARLRISSYLLQSSNIDVIFVTESWLRH